MEQLMKGEFTLDVLWPGTRKIDITVGLNVFSPVVMPYPLSKKEVTTDFVVRVLASWRHLFRSVWGQVSATDPDVKITWAGVFEELIGRLNSSDLMAEECLALTRLMMPERIR
jgi:hypothetical protein